MFSAGGVSKEDGGQPAGAIQPSDGPAAARSSRSGRRFSLSRRRGKSRYEEFYLKSQRKAVDILVVVDASTSMNHHLTKLGQSLAPLLSAIFDYDWQIAFTTADHGDHGAYIPASGQDQWRSHVAETSPAFGRLMFLENSGRILKRRVLTPDMPDYESIFFHTVSHYPGISCGLPPGCHNSNEQPLRALKSSIERAGFDNQDFFRPGVDFVSLIIANEDERDQDPKRAARAEDVIQSFYKQFGGQGKKFIAFNILVKDEACWQAERAKSLASIGKRIGRLALLTGRQENNISICAASYQPGLQTISRYIKSSLENSVALSEDPVPGTVRVRFKKGGDIRWTLYGRKIVFQEKIERGSRIGVFYQAL